MLSKRVIPVLLLKNKGLVKTIQFKNPTYVGDPINAVRIFNEKEIDELVFLDITASINGTEPNYEMVQDIATECFMPFGYGGGITRIDQIKKLFQLGVEKVILNSIVYSNPNLITEAATIFGSQSIICSVDVRKNVWGKYELYSHSGSKKQKVELLSHLKNLVSYGTGEIFVNSIDKDGIMKGYDIDLIKKITEIINVPIVCCGGAGSMEHLKDVFSSTQASGLAAGSLFVFYGRHKAVLINYPTQKELQKYII
jgi:cyclase